MQKVLILLHHLTGGGFVKALVLVNVENVVLQMMVVLK